MLLPMDQEGVSVEPIQLISGESPFNETFFVDAIAMKSDLVGELNKGWTVGKRLLQHERSGMESLVAGSTSSEVTSLADEARNCLGDAAGVIKDSGFGSRYSPMR